MQKKHLKSKLVFLFSTLKKIGFGELFIHWVRILYTSPMATITTNGLISQHFTLHRGTRQGCPLSPSLFAIFIEPLVAAIRQKTNITGIQTENMHHKIMQTTYYFFCTKTSLLPTRNYWSHKHLFYFKISDYTINWSKSTILPLNPNSWGVAALTSPLSFCVLVTSHI